MLGAPKGLQLIAFYELAFDFTMYLFFPPLPPQQHPALSGDFH